jgi:hypothetical protein
MPSKKIGLLIGDENDWPSSIEALTRRLPANLSYRGQTYDVQVERIRIHPFPLTAPTSYNVVIDRLAYWHHQPREWLKKAALVNRVYLLNNPFTFQSMEKHSAYCAMIRLGLNIPETWLIPAKNPPEGKEEKYAITAVRYHDLFNLPDIARQIGYPLYMKPFDGGGWRGVSQVLDEAGLIHSYDESGRVVMHLQQGLDDFEVFVRSLAIGPQVSSFKYDPSQPMHGRYIIDHNFLNAEQGKEAQTITKIINAFFRWDFNSCEAILKNGVLWPIDFANACPDIAVTSLHYYYPWAIKALFAWTLFCTVSERPMSITMNMEDYFAIADDPDRSYNEKLEAYVALADKHLQADEFAEFKATCLPHLDEVMWHYVQSDEFDHMLIETVKTTFPTYEHEQFIAHFRGLMRHWVEANPA